MRSKGSTAYWIASSVFFQPEFFLFSFFIFFIYIYGKPRVSPPTVGSAVSYQLTKCLAGLPRAKSINSGLCQVVVKLGSTKILNHLSDVMTTVKLFIFLENINFGSHEMTHFIGLF